MEQSSRTIFVFSAPSGAGKTTIVKAVKAHFPNMGFSVSATTRSPRMHERHGKDYYFLSPEAFSSKVKEGAFLEWEEVYEGLSYGTLKSEVNRMRAAGQYVLFDVDVQGGIQIKKYYGEEAVSIFIQPPSIDELRDRLEKRASNTPEDIDQRCQKAAEEISFADQFDHIILNDVLEDAIQEVFSIIERSVSHSQAAQSQD